MISDIERIGVVRIIPADIRRLFGVTERKEETEMPTPEVTEKLAREIAQSYVRQLSDDASHEKEFQYRAGIRRAVTIMYGYEYEKKLSDVVANLSRETVFGSK